jgi:hypothetical protein
MNFPPVTKSFWQLLGPSVLFVALSLNGGEMLLWPELIAKYGLLILWIVPIILYLQYSVNIEIERYTLVTGKNTLTRLASTTHLVSLFVVFGVVISLLWPAWISTVGSTIQYLFGFQGVHTSTIISIALLILLLLLWNNKNYYSIMENSAKIGMIMVLTISIGIVVYLLGVERIPLKFGTRWFPDRSDSFSYVAALAFGGVAGVLNLVQSDWIASRKYGATALKKPEHIDFTTDESKTHWNQWWNIITKEHFTLFFMGNIIGITLIGIVAALTLPGFSGSGFDIIRSQIDFFLFNTNFPLLGFAWGIGVILLFLMAQITILDAAGKLLKKVSIPFLQRYPSSTLSQYTGILGIMVLCTGLLFPAFSQPGFLLKTSAVLSAGIMALYPIMLIRINSTLPTITQPGLLAKARTICASLFYGGVVIWMISTFV